MREYAKLSSSRVIHFEPQINSIKTIPKEYHNKSTEEIYNKLKDKFDEQMQNFQNSSRQSDTIEQQTKNEKKAQSKIQRESGTNPCDHASVSDQMGKEYGDQLDLEEERWDSYMKNEFQEMEEKMRGLVPGQTQSYLTDIDKDTKIPWQQLLERYIQATVISDVSWKRPSKSGLANNFYFPGVEKNHLTVIVGIDTSGSVSNDELKEFVTEIYQIMVSFGNLTMVLIDCDAHVQNVQIIEDGESVDDQDLPWEGRGWYGRGGTKFEPVFEWVEESLENGEIDKPEILIYFTDMYGSFPDEEPDYSTIWISNSNVDHAPFGDVILYERDQ